MKKSIVFRITTVLIGTIMISLCGFILTKAHLGSDSIMVFNQGISKFLNINLGIAIIIGNAIFFVFILLFYRKSIGLGTIIVMFGIGLVTTGITYIDIIPDVHNNTLIQILMDVGAILLGSLGVALYVKSDIGLSPFEAFQIHFKNKLNIRYMYVKIVFDIVLFLTGILMNGEFGYFSIVTVFLYGPLIDLFMTIIDKMGIFVVKEKKENSIEKTS